MVSFLSTNSTWVYLIRIKLSDAWLWLNESEIVLVTSGYMIRTEDETGKYKSQFTSACIKQNKEDIGEIANGIDEKQVAAMMAFGLSLTEAIASCVGIICAVPEHYFELAPDNTDGDSKWELKVKLS